MKNNFRSNNTFYDSACGIEIIKMGLFAIATSLTISCSPFQRESDTKDIITNIDEPDGSTFYYRKEGENLTRSRCRNPEQPTCEDNKQSVNYQHFKQAFATTTYFAREARREAVYALLNSSVPFRFPASGDLLPDLYPLLAKLGVSFKEAMKRGMIAITSGNAHSCFFAKVGKAYCWGQGHYGQLGNGGDRDVQPSPTAVAGGIVFSSLTAGGSHTCGIAEGGKTYCWGYGTQGQLGIGTNDNRFSPTEVSGDLIFSSVTAGDSHTCGIVEGGKAYCWGRGHALGNGNLSDKSLPTAVSGNLVFSSIAAGSHTCGITDGGKAYCWGFDGVAGFVREPSAVPGEFVFSSLTVGRLHTCGIAEDGKTYCWGKGTDGQLGNGSVSDKSSPTAVTGGFVFSSLTAGGSHTCGIAEGGKTYCWGKGADGQLGNGTFFNDKSSPEGVSYSHPGFTSVTAGDRHTCGIDVGGKAYCWGLGAEGRLGSGGTSSNRPSVAAPIQVDQIGDP